MWIETLENGLVNMDWVTLVKIKCSGDPVCDFPYEIRAYEKSGDGWFSFGHYKLAEANEEYARLKRILMANNKW